jgi:hypothetical protein
MIVDVGAKSTAPLAHLETLAKELQAAGATIPAELRAVSSDASRREQVLRNANVACVYYFVMMMLTRPFLLASMRMRGRRHESIPLDGSEPVEAEGPETMASIRRGAMASFDSAVKLIQLVHELLAEGLLFNNMVFVM